MIIIIMTNKNATANHDIINYIRISFGRINSVGINVAVFSFFISIRTYKHACITRFLVSRKASDEELQIAEL